jgi:DNA (cytosine-5)-methyltransferase 1
MIVPVKYIDLFAGCGGISLGLHKSGLQGLFAVEKNSDAFLTLKHNLIDNHKHFQWPEWLPVRNWNVNSLLKDENKKNLEGLSGQVDLIVGGPPCQGFSIAGKRRASDDRNRLIQSYLSFVESVQPRAILFENVHGFTFKYLNSRNHKKIAYSDIVINKLIELGYTDACGEMIDMSEYGVPQRRKRFIVIGTKENLTGKIFEQLKNGCNEFLKSRGLKKKNTAVDAISDLEYQHGITQCPDSKSFMSGKVSKPKSTLQKYLRLQMPATESYIPNSHRFVKHKADSAKLFADLLEKAPRNKSITKSDDRDLYGIKKRSLTVLDPHEPVPTITTIPDDFIHYSEPRVMTVRECARLQSFPDWFEFKGRYTTGNKARRRSAPRYTQVGNAVPPLFAEQVGIAIRKVLEND